MRILFVAMAESVHTARWLAQIADQGWDLHIFPSIEYGVINPELRNVTVYNSVYARQPDAHPSVKMKGIHVALPIFKHKRYPIRRKIAAIGRLYWQESRPNHRIFQLARVIKKTRPDIIHSIEFQHGGYLTLGAYDALGGKDFPTWIATNWGSDIYLFGRLAEHRANIRRILELCDFYSCECERDVKLAQEMGLKGQVLPVFPNTGGIDLELVSRLREYEPPSSRRTIIVKGYQHFAGRAQVALRALALCADELKDYRIVLYSAFPDVKISAEITAQNYGLNIECLPPLSHEAMLRVYAQSRLYIGLSISDAISTSLLESMATGAFPIQSCTACADEWITDGETGLIVPPEDPQVVAEAIRRALHDERLVDRAAELNAQTCRERLDYHHIRAQAVDFYHQVMAKT